MSDRVGREFVKEEQGCSALRGVAPNREVNIDQECFPRAPGMAGSWTTMTRPSGRSHSSLRSAALARLGAGQSDLRTK